MILLLKYRHTYTLTAAGKFWRRLLRSVICKHFKDQTKCYDDGNMMDSISNLSEIRDQSFSVNSSVKIIHLQMFPKWKTPTTLYSW